MPTVLKKGEIAIKDRTTGEYTKYVNVVAEQTTEDMIEDIQQEGSTQVGLVEAKGESVMSDIPASYDDLNNIVADSYDPTKTYSVGDYVRYYDGTHDKLYRCIGDITTAETWTKGHWTEVVLANEIGVTHENHSDIMYGQPRVSSWFVDPDTGEGRTLAGFTSIVDIPVPNEVYKLWPYNPNSPDHSLRSICQYQADGTFISGIAGRSYEVQNGLGVNLLTKKISVTIGQGSVAGSYLSSIKGGDKIKTWLDSNIQVNTLQIKGLNIIPSPQLENRKPTFAFIFDDGTDGDVNVKELFDEYGFKCGFALIGDSNAIVNRERYLSYQEEGYEILSHSINGTAFSTITDLTTAEDYLQKSKARLMRNGFSITGWVTPNSWLNANQMPLVCKYYQYGFGHLSGIPEGIAYHSFVGNDIRQLDRWSLESNTITDTMTKINEAISNNSFMIFYGHYYPATNNNMTEENMETILAYLKTFVDTEQVIVDTPRNCVNHYYSFRHSDLLNIISQ